MKKLLLVILAAASAALSSAQTTYVSNLFTSTDNGVYIRDNLWEGRAFTTGAHAEGYTLDAITLDFFTVGSDPSFSVSLWSSAGILLPSAELTSLASLGGNQFAPATPFTLAANTTYWVVLESTVPFDVSTSYIWSMSLDSTKSEVDGWTMGASASSTNGGDTWSNLGNAYKFSVDASPVVIPEPATWAALIGLAALGLVWVQRRRAAVAR